MQDLALEAVHIRDVDLVGLDQAPGPADENATFLGEALAIVPPAKGALPGVGLVGPCRVDPLGVQLDVLDHVESPRRCPDVFENLRLLGEDFAEIGIRAEGEGIEDAGYVHATSRVFGWWSERNCSDGIMELFAMVDVH